MNRTTERATAALGTLAGALGLWGLVTAAGDVGWAADRGPRLGAFIHVNLTGALLMLVIGVVALSGSVLRQRGLLLAAAGLAALGVVLVAVGTGRDWNPLGASASTLSLLIGLTAGFAALAEFGQPSSDADRAEHPNGSR